MTLMHRTSSRCDQIIALIDRCLADYEHATQPAKADGRRVHPASSHR